MKKVYLNSYSDIQLVIDSVKCAWKGEIDTVINYVLLISLLINYVLLISLLIN